MEILKQLGDLFLAAVPTAVFVFLFYLFLRWSFFGPIEGVVRERGRRIEGARREAEELRKTAREKSHAYQDALRKARAELFREQEAARRAALDERGASMRKSKWRARNWPPAPLNWRKRSPAPFWNLDGKSIPARQARFDEDHGGQVLFGSCRCIQIWIGALW